jgi:hypothetical protein
MDKAMAFDCSLELCHMNEIVLALKKSQTTKNNVNFVNNDRTWMLRKTIIII